MSNFLRLGPAQARRQFPLSGRAPELYDDHVDDTPQGRPAQSGHCSDSAPLLRTEQAAEFTALARELMVGHHAGVLTTVDEEARPHARWMGTTSLSEFPRFHSITSPHSAKVAHIERNPRVDWMFSSANFSLILNFASTAHILRDTASIKRAWRAIEDKSQAFFLDAFNEKPGFVVIETVVCAIQCTVPRENLQWSMSIQAFQKTLSSAVPPEMAPHAQSD